MMVRFTPSPSLHSWYDPQRVLKERFGTTWQTLYNLGFIPGTTRRGY